MGFDLSSDFYLVLKLHLFISLLTLCVYTRVALLSVCVGQFAGVSSPTMQDARLGSKCLYLLNCLSPQLLLVYLLYNF